MSRHAVSTVVCLVAALALAYTTPGQQPSSASLPPAQHSPSVPAAQPSHPVSTRDRRRAAKLFLEGTQFFEKSEFDRAMQAYQSAAALEPENKDYALAAQVARSHAVTALIQSSTLARTRGDAAAGRAALAEANRLDPGNPMVAEHVSDLAADAAATQSRALYEDTGSDLGEAPRLEPAAGVQSFHLKTDQRQLIQRVYRAYGIETSLDQSVSAPLTRFDMDGATFAQATQALEHVTDSFAVPLDAHRVVVARDTRQNRLLFERQETETLYLPGLLAADRTEVGNIAKNVFGAAQIAVSESRGTITLRAPASSLDAFNATMHDLVEGRSQVMLDVQIIQLAHTASHETGVQLPQQTTAFNVYSEEQSILNANQALVQEIISSGLASANDPLAILGILIASGQVSSSIFSNGIALFGGGLTLSGLSPNPATVHFDLNSSDTRALDHVRLRLSDGQDETLRSGSRYPIQTASYSGLNLSGVNIPGLTTAGSSGSLASLAALGSAQVTIPQVQYQDLGLTLKANPTLMRSGDVALNLDLNITSLSGSFSDGNPILNNRSYSGVITIKTGQGALLMSELDQQESRALSGTPGLDEIPGLSNAGDKEVEKDYATLLIILTPHVIQGPVNAGHTPMLRVERGNVAP